MAVPSRIRLKDMKQGEGSGTWWGPLFGAHAATWAETWEGPEGWGTPVYMHVLDRAQVGPGTTLLDCGCGAGRFVRLAAERGASPAGIDAARAPNSGPHHVPLPSRCFISFSLIREGTAI